MLNTAKIDLHLHLDGSVNLQWLWKKSIERGTVPPDFTLRQVFDIMDFDNMTSAEDGIAKFDFPIAVMQTEQDLQEAAYNLVQTLNEQGLIYAEIRYASQQHTRGGLTQRQTIAAVLKGMEMAMADYPEIEVRLINCLMHKGENALSNMAENMEALEASRQFLGKGLVAVDLAGYENTGDFMLYAPLFERAKQLGLPYTIHAGEMGDGSHVPMAIAMGAQRIGHGINCVDNPEWLKAVVDSQIPLEVCVTSNGGFGFSYASHPVRKLLDAGVKVTLNTDNMTFSKTNLINEHNQLRCVGVTPEQLWQCTLNAVDVAFCDEKTKRKLRKKLGV